MMCRMCKMCKMCMRCRKGRHTVDTSESETKTLCCVLCDCPFYLTYLYLDFHLCYMTKIKERNREIC